SWCVIVYSCSTHFYIFLDLLVFFFFFFQAEDGIRDGHVTGVQTCAFRSQFLGGTRTGAGGQPLPFSPAVKAGPFVFVSGQIAMRSEERRVGKECRSRWAAYH